MEKLATQQPRVLVLGGDTRHNHGDRAIRCAVVEQLRRSHPAVRVVVVSHDPNRDRKDWGVEVAGTSAFSLLGRVRLLRELDLVWWGGGHLLQDDSCVLKNTYWAVALGALRRLCRCAFVGGGVGIGPLETAWGRFFARCALSQLDALAVRDGASAQAVRQVTAGAMVPQVLPDPAILLRPGEAAAARAVLERQGVPLETNELRIGVSMRQWFHVARGVVPSELRYLLGARRRQRFSSRFEQFLDRIAGVLNHIGRDQPTRVLFFPMGRFPWDSDDWVGHALSARLRVPSHVVDVDVPSPVVKAMMGFTHFFVAVRLHAAILAMGMNVPTFVIAYGAKHRDFMQQLGLLGQVEGISEVAGPDGEARLLDGVSAMLKGLDELRQIQARRWKTLLAEAESRWSDFIRRAFSAKRAGGPSRKRPR